jgi:hypothetical protein
LAPLQEPGIQSLGTEVRKRREGEGREEEEEEEDDHEERRLYLLSNGRGERGNGDGTASGMMVKSTLWWCLFTSDIKFDKMQLSCVTKFSRHV